MITLILISLGLYPLSCLIMLIQKRESLWVTALLSTVGSAALAAAPLLGVLGGAGELDFQNAWGLPLGSFHLHMDPLSAWFALPVLILPVLVSWYGRGYMSHSSGRRGVRYNWIFLQLLSGGMYLVLLAWDGILFLFAWELMSFAAWFLVMFDHEGKTVRRAGWIYLAATHLGTAFLFALFVLCGTRSGSYDFSTFSGLILSGNAVFLTALIGFGSKAGLFGLHVWLPEAHPAAPSHVSGLMSGVMIKMGVYGIFRILALADSWASWWGWTLVILGILSGLLGVLYAAVQHDIKRFLAYSSVENVGIICMSMGIGVLGSLSGSPAGVLGFAGALLHILNHSVFKTLLFMSAGSVVHASGTRQMDNLGGLGKKMPWTAAVFITASAAVCALPPMNGFASELLIYLAGFQGALFNAAAGYSVNLTAAGFLVIAALALIGGLAVLCFTRAVGGVFLGTGRSSAALESREVGWGMRLPMVILAAGCLLLGMGASLLLPSTLPVAGSLGCFLPGGAEILSESSTALLKVSGVAGGVIIITLLFWLLKIRLLKGRRVEQEATWGCGFRESSPRMQYSSSSYVEPLSYAFRTLFQGRRKGENVRGLFPGEASFESDFPDPFMRFLFIPLFSGGAKLSETLRVIQNGRLNLYILYIVLTLAGILIWSFI